MHRYTQEQISYIRSIAKRNNVSDIQQKFNSKFGTKVSFKSIKGIMYRQKIKNCMLGCSTRFKKGHKPWNKDMKGIVCGGEETQFKKGQIPPSHKPVGSESFKEGYVWVKVSEPNKWIKKHHLIWIEENGAIPEGHVLRFADGNKMNVTLDNLFLTSRRVMTSVVKRGMNYGDPDLNVTTHKLAELELTIKDIEKESKD